MTVYVHYESFFDKISLLVCTSQQKLNLRRFCRTASLVQEHLLGSDEIVNVARKEVLFAITRTCF